MAVRNFTLYDLLADIVPGALTISFGFILFGFPDPKTMEWSGLLLGSAFFVFSYFIGRIIHTIGSVFDHNLKTIYKWTPVSGVENELEIEELIELYSPEGTDYRKQIPREISPTVLASVDSYFSQELGSNYEAVEAKMYGESLLYKETTLYSKYESLVTFFRSMFLIPWFLLLCYAFLWFATCLWDTNLEPINLHNTWEVSSVAILVLSLLISPYGGSKFWRVRNIAFINELHAMFVRDDGT